MVRDQQVGGGDAGGGGRGKRWGGEGAKIWEGAKDREWIWGPRVGEQFRGPTVNEIDHRGIMFNERNATVNLK
jgi:hypothetical protein